jgi:hypothetical protein
MNTRTRRFVLVCALAGCGFMLPAIVGCSCAPQNVAAPPAGPSAPSGTPTAAVNPGGPVTLPSLKIGETFDYQGLKVTVVSVGDGPADVEGKPTYSVKVRYENASTAEVTYNQADWKLQGADGTKWQNNAMMPGGPKELGSGQLAPGATKEDTVHFQLKQPVATVIYESSFHSRPQNTASWAVK